MDGAGDLERWAADARAREAADARVRERWLLAQAAESANLAGLLLALAERRETVVVATVAGRRHRGVVTGVGEDFVAIEAQSGAITLVALSGLGDVRVAERAPRLGTQRAATTGRDPARWAPGSVTCWPRRQAGARGSSSRPGPPQSWATCWRSDSTC
jgi:hypothetical protein